VNYTTPGGVIKPGIMVMEISGAATAAVLDTLGGFSSNASVTTAYGNITTFNANDILIFATDTAGNESGWTAGTGYAIPSNKVATGASGSNVRQAMQYAVVSSLQKSSNTSMSYTNAAWNGSIFAAFKAASGSTGGSAEAAVSPPSLTFGSQIV